MRDGWLDTLFVDVGLREFGCLSVIVFGLEE